MSASNLKTTKLFSITFMTEERANAIATRNNIDADYGDEYRAERAKDPTLGFVVAAYSEGDFVLFL